jgi:hypothetical protein
VESRCAAVVHEEEVRVLPACAVRAASLPSVQPSMCSPSSEIIVCASGIGTADQRRRRAEWPYENGVISVDCESAPTLLPRSRADAV